MMMNFSSCPLFCFFWQRSSEIFQNFQRFDIEAPIYVQLDKSERHAA